MWTIQQKRTSDGECLRSHLVAFPRISVIEQTSKDVCSASMTMWRFVCSNSPCVDAKQFLTNPFGKQQICWRMFVQRSCMLLKWRGGTRAQMCKWGIIINRPLIAFLSLYTPLKRIYDKEISITGLVHIINGCKLATKLIENSVFVGNLCNNK